MAAVVAVVVVAVTAAAAEAGPTLHRDPTELCAVGGPQVVAGEVGPVARGPNARLSHQMAEDCPTPTATIAILSAMRGGGLVRTR